MTPVFRNWIFVIATCGLFFLWVTPDSAIAQGEKSGLGASSGSLTSSANARWAYDWGNGGAGSGHNGEYVPMFWNGGGNIEATAARLIDEANSDYVLGFNEPERANQSNLSVATAISRWRRISDSFDGSGIKLVSPAPSDTADGRAWLNEFMAEVDADPDLHVDEVAFHWYGTVNINNPAGGANSFLNRVAQYHNTYNRNVWITEFAGIDWGGNYTTQQMNDWNEAFLDIVIPELESRDYVTRYAWWNHNDDSRLVESGAYGRTRATQVGDTYVGTLSTGDVRDMNGDGLGLDFQYLRGGMLLNNGADRGASFGRLYAMANHDGSAVTSRFGGSGDWSIHSWGNVTIEDDATLSKVGLNTVTFRNLDLEIDGRLLLEGGTANEGILEISGSGTNARGDGLIQANWPGSHLRLGRAGDSGVLVLPYDLQLRHQSNTTIESAVDLGGDIAFQGGTANLIINHDFEFNGIASSNNTAGFAKHGSATLTLNGANTYTGNTTVREGSLIVNGSHVGGGNYNVNGGLLGGSGSISSNVSLNSGSIAPGAAASTGTQLTIEGNFTQAAGSTVSLNTYATTNDSLDIGGTANLAGNLVLNSVDADQLQIGQSLNFINVTGGVSGSFVTIDGIDVGQVDGLNAGLAVLYGNNDVSARVSILGDADFSNRVDNSDIGTVFANFESVSNPQWTGGDFDGDNTVSNSDIGIVFANFGSATGGSFLGKAFSDDSVADLIYDPNTGEIILDGNGAIGGALTNFVLKGTFIGTDDVSNPFDSLFFTSNAGELSASDGAALGLGLIELGAILETDLTLAELEKLFETSSYVGALGTGQFNFNFVVAVPEPSAFIALLFGASALATRRRRTSCV